MDVVLQQDIGIRFFDETHPKCERSTVQCLLLITDSSTLAPNEVNANTKLYMRIWSRNLTALLSLLVKRTSSSCGIARRLGNIILLFSQHRENCGLLLFDFANHSLIHIFALQNPQIVSISPQSHRAGADVSLFANNWNASLPKESCALVVACCMICCSQHKQLFHFYGVWNGPSDSIHCLARRSLCKQLQCSRADFDVSWLNYVRTLICGIGFSKESVCSSFY
jgi:hypothetical protein